MVNSAVVLQDLVFQRRVLFMPLPGPFCPACVLHPPPLGNFTCTAVIPGADCSATSVQLQEECPFCERAVCAKRAHEPVATEMSV
uniref:Uncharacterized protein n=1 Tax=Anguilla anguilla TaxID=7936 RepID=A0A0E9RSU4_ANGAN